ncbi:S8/S53 family peptidase [Shewanella profunda]|uniref:S8 family peptidase n=1 Tax=Shewanella profunda TaxID=254793 RepID=UPI00200F5CB2|nr:S8/S53 family peptidase [Shewanella profunda]MCL1090360.1 S8/S53 family peptidase [Shewanella profunda]
MAFKNYGQWVWFESASDGLYRQKAADLTVQFAPRLIVKTAREVTTAEMALMAPDATRITDLFLMNRYRYFLLHYDRQTQAFAALVKLQAEAKLLLIQPDLRQQRQRSVAPMGSGFERTSAANEEWALPAYLAVVKRNGLWPSNGGKGVTVAVIDDGFELSHPEFAQLNTRFYYDFSIKQLVDANPRQEVSTGLHGTKIAGVLFGLHNHRAPEGLAPKANFVGISQRDTWTSQTLQSFYIAYLAKADVINCSWHSQWLLEPIEDVVDVMGREGREGKGVAVVFAAGNKGKLLTLGMHEASIASAIVVGATDANGKPLKSSNFGNTVDVWVFSEKIISADANGSYSYFSGTSVSAAIITGYIALLIANDPSLDVDQVLDKLRTIPELWKK